MSFRPRNIITYSCLFIIAAFSSCVAIKDYPKGKAFFYENKVKINGELPSNDKALLKEKLLFQIDDTAQPQVKTGFYFFKAGNLISNKYIKNPPAYDTNAVIASANNMRNLLLTQGYFRGTVNWSNPPVFRASKDSQMIRTYVTYTANLGKEFRFNDIKYSFRDTVMSAIAEQNRKNSFINRKDVFTKSAVNNENDRLVNLFRNNGFYKINREAMYNVIDTFPAELLDPSLSEIELIEQQIESEKRRQNPVVDIEVKQSTDFDTTRLKQFYIRSLVVNPDHRPDSVYLNDKETSVNYKGLSVTYHDFIIHLSVLRRLIVDTAKGLYNQSNFNQSITNLNRLGVWQSISADAVEVNDTIIDGKAYGQLDLHFRLTPATKYTYTYNLNASRNTGNNFSGIVSQAALFGLSLEGSRTNRNFLKEGIQTNLAIRGGVEFYRIDTIQTLEAGISQSFVFPKLVGWPFGKTEGKFFNQRSFINFSGTYTNRRNFFELYQASGNLGWEWSTKRNNNLTYILRPISAEYLFYPPNSKLDTLIRDNPFLRYTFNSGLILGPAFTLLANLPSKTKNTRNTFKLNIEESSFGTLINSKRILPYFKFDAEFKHTVTYKKAAFVFRAYGGVGTAYGSDTTTNVIMPLPKQFVAGGPNSMRAWRLRKLGLGTMPRASTGIDRTGDVQLELNTEYRFNLFPVYGFMLEGALFVDAGNVWVKSIRSAPGSDMRAVFSLNQLYPGIAIAAGTGLRLNFGQFAIRLDWGYTIKDPQFSEINAGWFPTNNDFGSRQALQFNVNYPF